ncbi:hypothetical protein SAMN05216389_1309 [Oceanobacillus limi]|uniref:Uncharacterized protein n=1 Tax=Oceanobacillus limi TaxID=930131 RepID=A0A1I0H9E4_9BACI|nr:hypothetical protein SAMN05216389_1309 [Oceanobacillus limi]
MKEEVDFRRTGRTIDSHFQSPKPLPVNRGKSEILNEKGSNLILLI